MEGLVNGASPAIVFFDLETSGFGRGVDILQISMRCDSQTFDRYINPTRRIPRRASDVHNLVNGPNDGDLYYMDDDIYEQLPSQPRNVVFKDMLNYLQQLKRQCILVAHNCFCFDSSHLMSAIVDENLEREFDAVIVGFTDTLIMMKNKFPERKSGGELKLKTLANELGIPVEGVHDATVDVDLLEAVASAHFTVEQLVENRKSFAYILEREQNARETALYKTTFRPLEAHISNLMITRIASRRISYEMIITAHRRGGDAEVTELLEQRVNGKPQLIKKKLILNKILDHCREETGNSRPINDEQFLQIMLNHSLEEASDSDGAVDGVL